MIGLFSLSRVMEGYDQVAEQPAELSALRLERLLAATAVGDLDAFEEVYRLTSARLFGICLRILTDRADAEEALQDCFVRLWRSADTFDPDRGSALAWLTTLARNRAIDRLRGRAAASRQPDGEAMAQPTADREGGDWPAQDGLAECLGQLDRREQEFIRNAFFVGKTYAELAREVDLPLGTVKSSIRRALIRLKDCLS